MGAAIDELARRCVEELEQKGQEAFVKRLLRGVGSWKYPWMFEALDDALQLELTRLRERQIVEKRCPSCFQQMV